MVKKKKKGLKNDVQCPGCSLILNKIRKPSSLKYKNSLTNLGCGLLKDFLLILPLLRIMLLSAKNAVK